MGVSIMVVEAVIAVLYHEQMLLKYLQQTMIMEELEELTQRGLVG